MSQDRRDRGFSARTPVSFLLGVVAVLLLPPAVALAWLSAVGTRADLFVDTLGPIVRTTQVQQSLTAAMTSQAMGQVSGGGRQRPLVQDAVRRAVIDVVASDQFATIWADAVRRAHGQLVSAMAAPPSTSPPSGSTGADGQPVDGSAERGVEVVVTVPLDAVAGRLNNLGVSAPAGLAPSARVSVLSAGQVDRLRPAYTFVSTYGLWAPFVVVGVGVLSVGLAMLRRRAAWWLLGGWGLGLALLAAALALARPYAVDLLVGTVEPSRASALPLRPVVLAGYDAAAASVERWLVVGGVTVALLLLVTALSGLLGRGRTGRERGYP